MAHLLLDHNSLLSLLLRMTHECIEVRGSFLCHSESKGTMRFAINNNNNNNNNTTNNISENLRNSDFDFNLNLSKKIA